MIRATTVIRRPAVKPERVADTLVLDHEARHRRRIALTGQRGLEFLLDLDRATVLDDGDAVKLEDGRLVQVKAAPEALIEIRTDNPLRLMKVAWHIGNRHVAAEITADALYIAHDHVLLEMVRGLGATASTIQRPFRPERGAYDDHADCGHDHGHAHGHGHAHDEEHSHGHEHSHAHEHAHEQGHGEHGAACGCGHDHAHAHAPAHADRHDAHEHGHTAGHEHRHDHG